MKVFVVGGSVGYANWVKDCELVNSIEESDLVFFTGGEDVYSPLYGEEGKWSYFGHVREDLGMPRRDWIEKAAFESAKALGKAMFGTCRGLQMLTVLNGGKLIQDMDHPYNHILKWADGTESYTNSLHHQMCWPHGLPKEEYKVLAVAQNKVGESLSPVYNSETLKQEEIFEEPEVIWYPKTRSMGIQGHPEMMVGNKEVIDKLNNLLTEKLGL